MNLIGIPALLDNYIWLLYNNSQECLVIDPGEATPVLQLISKKHLRLRGILLTHHHSDHVSGVQKLVAQLSVPVYGPKETIIKGTNCEVVEGDKIALLGLLFSVLALPGHTVGHIGFYSAPWLFCGDTVFSAGCGRLFEGTPQQMYESFQKINQLPPETLICGAHEYTLSNITFAATILPQDKLIMDYQYHIKKLMVTKKTSLPTNLRLERQINLFFRCHEINLQNKLNFYPLSGEEWQIFAILRQKRDLFKGG